MKIIIIQSELGEATILMSSIVSVFLKQQDYNGYDKNSSSVSFSGGHYVKCSHSVAKKVRDEWLKWLEEQE